jgi:hypothetical protein
MLTLETLGPNGKITVNRRFAQNGIYCTVYGIPLGGRGHHPEKALFEDAVKWMSSGGLSSPSKPLTDLTAAGVVACRSQS